MLYTYTYVNIYHIIKICWNEEDLYIGETTLKIGKNQQFNASLISVMVNLYSVSVLLLMGNKIVNVTFIVELSRCFGACRRQDTEASDSLTTEQTQIHIQNQRESEKPQIESVQSHLLRYMCTEKIQTSYYGLKSCICCQQLTVNNP